jgi:hypothetical protein
VGIKEGLQRLANGVVKQARTRPVKRDIHKDASDERRKRVENYRERIRESKRR